MSKKREAFIREEHTGSLIEGNKEAKSKLEAIKVSVRKEAEREEKRFRDYMKSKKREESPYIERVHGEEISLLTEIVYHNNPR